MIFVSHCERFQSLISVQDIEIKMFCSNFPILNCEAVLADIQSFMFSIKLMFVKIQESDVDILN